jgi:hypothetical protein
MLKKIYAKLKMIFDTWKMWLFVVALFGTNGAQIYSNYEPTSEKPVKTVSTPIKPQKTVIIRKIDNKFCIDLLNEHKKGAQH